LFGPALHFNVDEQPALLAILAPDLDQHIGQARDQLGIADNLAQFRVEKYGYLLPWRRYNNE
jgi:hypothetical protein